MKSGIYGIIDSTTRKIVYIGRSANIDSRINTHRHLWKESTMKALQHGLIPEPINQSAEVCFAFLSLSGRQLEYIVLEEISDADEMENAEDKWADILIDCGHPLCNGKSDSLNVGSCYKAIVQQDYFIEGNSVKTNQYNRLEHPAVWEEKQKEFGAWVRGKCITYIAEISMIRNNNPTLYQKIINGEITTRDALSA
ncbi:GIY-YIG nuclease family protein, partial [Desulfamplus magnetovallimortis]|uniref:GIY-YIG nuclease family protein n=1 Tax=Desulfamplus magnetovallimortis TaxID=1246637 RepID=UPI00111813FD